MEIRKLYDQMTAQEKTFLNSFLTKDKYKLGEYAIKREKEKVITEEQVYRAIEDGKIVEYHYKDSNRILVRGNVDEGGYNVVVVLDVQKREIITVYDNEANDHHYTLDRSKYRKHFDVISMFKN